MLRMTRWAGMALLLALMLGGVAMARQSAAPAREITIVAKDFSYDMPDTVEAGYVGITLENQGAELHHANIGRLQDGKTFDDFTAALKQGEGPALALLEFAGGPGQIAPGRKQRVVTNLREGSYVGICFLPSADDGVPHFVKGMIKPFQVVASSDQGSAPDTSISVEGRDFAFEMPANIATGGQTWAFDNQGPQTHELQGFKIAEGKTVKDVLNFFTSENPQGPPPVDIGSAFGIGGVASGQTGWLDVNVNEGTYVAVCFIPDPATGKPHLALGMIAEFKVGAAPAGGTQPTAAPPAGAPGSLPGTGGSSLPWWLLGLGAVGLLVLGGVFSLRRKPGVRG